MLYSYDIFDTILTRKTATPHGIFALMQQRLRENPGNLPEEVTNGFYELRIQGERLARYYLREDDNEDVTLDQIYRAIGTTGLLDDVQTAVLKQMEYETELQNLVPIPRIVEEIREKIADGKRVIFISDMYWDKEHIYGMLEKALPDCRQIPLYVSSDIGKTKATGNMYLYVCEKEGINKESWIHTGDDEEGDYHIPCSLGIAARHVHKNKLISIERAVLKGCGDDPSIQLLTGLSKNTRLLCGLQGPGEIGASLGGFLVGSYVVWLLNDARRRGIKTLYFVARDGYVLKEVADLFIQKLRLGICTKYLYGSRKAWRLPGLMSENFDVLAFLRVSVPEFISDLSSIADIFGISLTELRTFLPAGLKEDGFPLSRIDVDVLFYYLAGSDSFKKYLLSVNRKKRALALGYLRQEIRTDEGQAAFVEVGGTGYTQRRLENILREFYTGKVMTYYFQLYSVEKGGEQSFLNFIPDGHYMKDAIEPLCRAMHGQTCGYIKKEGSVIEPVLEDDETRYMDACGYPDYIEGLRRYAACYAEWYDDLFSRPVNRKLVRKCWDYYTHAGDETIWDFVGEVPFSAVGNDGQCKKYAPKLGKEEIREIFVTGRNEPLSRIYHGSSLDASLCRLDEDGRKYLAECRRAADSKCGDMFPDIPEPAFVKIPTGRYREGTSIILYGAGNLGKAFFRQIKKSRKWNLAMWVDRQYAAYVKDGYPVKPPVEIGDSPYDVVLIAVLDKEVKESIRAYLLETGVPGDRIDWIAPREYLGK